MTNRRKPISERLWSKVTKLGPDDCWPFAGNLNKGYGVLKVDSTHKQVLAARVAYEVTHGPLPEGLEIDHVCRNRLCCNPAHLEPVTHTENMKRVWERGTRTGIVSGASRSTAKLTRADAEQIKVDPRSGRALAKVYGVDRTTIDKIRRGAAYKVDGLVVINHQPRPSLRTS